MKMRIHFPLISVVGLAIVSLKLQFNHQNTSKSLDVE